MSSFFDDASLVMIPSGFKDGKVYSVKPTSGAGDLTFTRNSNATRVDANGLVEKVRTNSLLQSNTFSTTWTNTSSTETSGQSGYDGSSDAWKIDINAAFGQIIQSVSVSGVSCVSVYAKAGTLGFVRLRFDASPNAIADFDLSDGSAAYTSGIISASSTAIGGGWYRVSMVSNVSSSTFRIYPIVAPNDLTATSGNIYIQDAQLEQGLVATDYIETTTTTISEFAGVTASSVADVPRLDYSGGASCPSLLLEPQRTNLVTNSEYFDIYTKSNATITNNDSLSPEGLTNATGFAGNGATSSHYIYQNFGTAVSGTEYTISFFAKSGSLEYVQIVMGSGAFGVLHQNFDLANGQIGSSSGSVTPFIESYTDEWYRVGITVTATASATITPFIALANSSTMSRLASFATSGDVKIYGLQIEAGSYPTSYIPTYGTTVTRLADSCNIDPSSLLGATEGSWFFELDDLSFEVTGTSVPTNLIGYDSSNCLAIEARASGQTKNIYFVKEESNSVTTLTTKTISTTLKACFVWNGTSLKVFVDGVKAYDTGGFTQPVAWSTFQFNASGREAQQTLKQTLLFPTAISDADAIALTA